MPDIKPPSPSWSVTDLLPSDWRERLDPADYRDQDPAGASPVNPPDWWAEEPPLTAYTAFPTVAAVWGDGATEPVRLVVSRWGERASLNDLADALEAFQAKGPKLRPGLVLQLPALIVGHMADGRLNDWNPVPLLLVGYLPGSPAEAGAKLGGLAGHGGLGGSFQGAPS